VTEARKITYISQTIKSVKADFVLFGTPFLKYSNSRMLEVGAFEIPSLHHYKYNTFEFNNIYIYIYIYIYIHTHTHIYTHTHR